MASEAWRVASAVGRNGRLPVTQLSATVPCAEGMAGGASGAVRRKRATSLDGQLMQAQRFDYLAAPASRSISFTLVLRMLAVCLGAIRGRPGILRHGDARNTGRRCMNRVCSLRAAGRKAEGRTQRQTADGRRRIAERRMGGEARGASAALGVLPVGVANGAIRTTARAEGADDSFRRFFLGSVGNEYSAFLAGLFFDGFDQDTIAEGFQLICHRASLFVQE